MENITQKDITMDIPKVSSKKQKIIKRNGAEVLFDPSKIRDAILKANSSVSANDRISSLEANEIAKLIEKNCAVSSGVPTVESIQDLVIFELMQRHFFRLAMNYQTYRYQHELLRKGNSTDAKVLAILNRESQEAKEENSNKNPDIVSVQRDYIAGEINKDIVRRMMLPPEIVAAHDEGRIHFHDADYAAQKIHNCCLVNIDDMLMNGTVISGTKIDPPHSFSTACNIVTQIIAQVASSQYGGQTISLTPIAKFVNITRIKFRKELLAEMAEQGITLAENQIDSITEGRVLKDIEKGVQMLQYQVITLMTTNGQAPFVSVAMYLNECGDDQRLRDDLALVIEEVLKQRIQGVKNEKGVWITPAFPKLLYFLEDDNTYQRSKYFYLTKLAAKCTAKRMVPDYISEKIMKQNKIDDNGDGQAYPCMGCVAKDEVIVYKLYGELYVESFERAWNRLSNYYKVEKQPNEKDLYMDTDGVEVFDQKKGFVKNYRIIRNWSDNWVNVKFNDGQILKCTDNHPFETENRGMVLAKDLRKDDIIAIDKESEFFEDNVYSKNNATFYVTPIEVKALDCEEYSYDVTTESEHFTVSGIWSHNCRSFLTPYVDPKTGKGKYYGRFNQGVVTINLPYVALSSGGDIDTFWTEFDETLELCHRALRIRHENLKGTLSDVAPILWQHGALARLQPGEKIDPLLYGGYSTISLGYAGLYEAVKYLTGHSHTSEEGKPLAMQIMQHLNDKCTEWRAAENIAYSLYGTPLESTTYKFAKALQNKFGIIPGITDHGYITNSYHVNVREEISAFDKLKFESEFQKLSPGGCISYVEVPNLNDNIDAVITLIQYIYETIMYAELNSKSDYCQVCGYDGEIKIIEEDNKLIWECPNCGNRDQSKMNVTRRTCGLKISSR